MSHAAPVANVPDEVKQKAAETGLGFIAPWVPQQLILHHKVRICDAIIINCGSSLVRRHAGGLFRIAATTQQWNLSRKAYLCA